MLVLVICQFHSSNPHSILLQRDYSFLRDINIWYPFVIIGVYSSTLSAAMSNLIGASRILYALAKDDLFGRWLFFVCCFVLFFQGGISTETTVVYLFIYVLHISDISVFICQGQRWENVLSGDFGVTASVAAIQSNVYLPLHEG